MNKNNRMVDVLVQCICCGDILGRIGMLVNSGHNETGKLSKIETLCDECSRKERKLSYVDAAEERYLGRRLGDHRK